MTRSSGVVLIALAVVALAACGDSGNSGNDDEPGSYTTTTGVAAPLVADFIFDVALVTPPSGFGCIPGQVTFTDTFTGDPTGWAWEFPDGSTSEEQNPQVDSIDNGEEVTLTISRGDQAADATKEISYPIC